MVYLLHFRKPISPDHTCQHYLGFTDDLDARLNEHRNGNGARLTQVACERGIGFDLVRVWEGDRGLERRLKNMKMSNRLCPICNPAGVHWCTENELDISAWKGSE